VKTSQWPYDDFLADRQFRDLSYVGLAAVARAARHSQRVRQQADIRDHAPPS
jgi:hypothetical protein